MSWRASLPLRAARLAMLRRADFGPRRWLGPRRGLSGGGRGLPLRLPPRSLLLALAALPLGGCRPGRSRALRRLTGPIAACLRPPVF
jgi:hypothetical protein